MRNGELVRAFEVDYGGIWLEIGMACAPFGILVSSRITPCRVNCGMESDRARLHNIMVY